MADNLPLSSADVTESGSLNLPEPSGPHRPVMRMLYLFYYRELVIDNVRKEKCKLNIYNVYYISTTEQAKPSKQQKST
jgi:hypothetical protein